MKLRRPRVGLLVLMVAAALPLAAATDPLNPLVTRTPQSGPVPAECAEGVAPAPVPRLDVRQIPLPPPVEPAELPAPPTGSLRSALEATQTALTRNDRPAFDAKLAAARSLLQDYPSGAQRRAAEELVRTYEAAARLWDAQYRSPFFDDASAEYALLRGYPGYEDAVRRSTLTRDARRYFPAGESRDFLGRVAAERLRGIGIQAPAPRLARNDRPGVPDSPRASSASRPSVSRSTARPRRTPSTTSARATRPPRSAAPSRPRLTTDTRTPASATSTPSTPNPSAPPTTAAAPEPAAPEAGTGSAAAASPAAEGTAPEDVPSSTETTETTEPTTATETTATAAPAEPAPETAEQPSRGRSVVLPTILILIGLGVLILLFRASK